MSSTTNGQDAPVSIGGSTTKATTEAAAFSWNPYLAAGIFATQVALDYFGNQKKAAAARRLAEVRDAQAQEVLRRSEFNVASFRTEADKIRSSQQASAASSGIDVGSGNVLMALEDTNSKMQEAISLERRQANYEANQIRAGADIARQQANDIRSQFLPNLASAGIQSYAAYNR